MAEPISINLKSNPADVLSDFVSYAEKHPQADLREYLLARASKLKQVLNNPNMSDYPYKAQDIAKIDSHIVPAFSETKDPNTGKIYGYISKAEAMDYALSLKAAATMLGEGAEGRLKTVTYENITLSPESIKKGITKNDALLDYIERAVVNGDPIKKAVYNDVFFNKDFAKSMFGALSLMEVEMVKYADLNGKVIQLPAGVVVGMNCITQPTSQPEAGAPPKKVPFFLMKDEPQVVTGLK